MEVFLVALGGAAGAVFRYGITKAVQPLGAGAFPFGIFVVNLSGAFLLGLVFTYLLERTAVSDELRLALTVGVLGAYTTFSTFSLDTIHLVQNGNWGLALLNISASVGGALAAAYAGQQLARV